MWPLPLLISLLGAVFEAWFAVMGDLKGMKPTSVSYTHLTLPTIYSV